MDLAGVRIELAALPPVAVERMRLHRLQSELQKREIGAVLLCDPINVRYATDCRSMQIWTKATRKLLDNGAASFLARALPPTLGGIEPDHNARQPKC